MVVRKMGPWSRSKGLNAFLLSGNPGAKKSIQTASGEEPAATGEAALTSDSELATRATNRWSRWHPFAPGRLGNVAHLVDVTREEAVVIRLQSLLAERRWPSESSGEQASASSKESESIWDRPASPPAHYRAATEKSERCKTHYRVHNLDHVLYSGDVPHNLLKRASGKKLLEEELSACASGLVTPKLEEHCLEVLAQWTTKTAKLREYYACPGDGTTAWGNQTSTRLVRSYVSVESLQVVRVQCELQVKNAPHPFQAWVLGEEERLYLADFPKAWTWKATAWVVLSTALGVPLGYLMESLVRWL